MNERFGTMVEVPSHVFKIKDPPPTNGDGRSLKAIDGAELSIYGGSTSSVGTKSFAEYKQHLLDEARKQGRKVKYSAEDRNWIVLSGKEGESIFYERVIEGCGSDHTFSITYPASKKDFYDPLVTRMSRSLRCQNQPIQNNLFGLKSCRPK